MDQFTFDDEYLRRLRERDRDTTAHFVSYFGELLQITLRSRLRSAEAVDDVRQEVFYRFFKKIDELREGSSIGSFVFSIRNNALLEHYRNEAKSRRDAVPPDEDWPTVEQDLIREESAERVRALLAILKPPRDAEVLRELFLNEKDKDEVCRQFDLTRENLRVVVHRALKRFKNLFARDDDDDPPGPV